MNYRKCRQMLKLMNYMLDIQSFDEMASRENLKYCKMFSCQLHYTKRNRFVPFLLAEILDFQGLAHLIGVGSFSYVRKREPLSLNNLEAPVI